MFSISTSLEFKAAATDTGSGVKEVNLYYSTDGGVTWTKIVMIPPMPPSVSYQGSIPAQGMMVEVQYYVEASDILGNAARSAIQVFMVGIPVWLYAIVIVIIVLIIAAALKVRKRPQPMPPPPPPT